MSTRITAVAILLLAASPIVAQETQPAPATQAADASSAADVMQRFYEATGGLAARQEVTSQRQIGTLEVVAMGMTGDMTILVAAPDKIRITIDLPGVGVIEQGAAGGVGWAVDPFNGARIMADGERLLLTRGLATPIADDLLQGFATVDLAAEPEDVEVADGEVVSARRLDLTTEAGDTISEWYAVDTGLRVKRSAAWQTDFGPEEQTIVYGDYQPVGDTPLLAAFLSEQTVGTNELAVRIEKAEANPDLPADAFALPPQVQKLLE